MLASLTVAHAAVNQWLAFYDRKRPHQPLDMATPAQRFGCEPIPARPVLPAPDRTGEDWVSRRVASNGVVSVSWQQVSVGKHHAGARCDVHVADQLLQFWIGNELCKTVARTTRGEVRKKRASIPSSTT